MQHSGKARICTRCRAALSANESILAKLASFEPAACSNWTAAARMIDMLRAPVAMRAVVTARRHSCHPERSEGSGSRGVGRARSFGVPQDDNSRVCGAASFDRQQRDRILVLYEDAIAGDDGVRVRGRRGDFDLGHFAVLLA